MKTLGDIFGVKIEKDMVKKRPMRVEDIDCSSRLEKYFKEHNSKVKHGSHKMREDFEKWFEKNLGAHSCQFDKDEDGNHEERETICAWYAFQEQQKIINMQECGATEIRMILEDSEYDDSTKLERISELLK